MNFIIPVASFAAQGACTVAVASFQAATFVAVNSTKAATKVPEYTIKALWATFAAGVTVGGAGVIVLSNAQEKQKPGLEKKKVISETLSQEKQLLQNLKQNNGELEASVALLETQVKSAMEARRVAEQKWKKANDDNEKLMVVIEILQAKNK